LSNSMRTKTKASKGVKSAILFCSITRVCIYETTLIEIHFLIFLKSTDDNILLASCMKVVAFMFMCREKLIFFFEKFLVH
jgi:hypothetical protein